jgi:hypothetical protein
MTGSAGVPEVRQDRAARSLPAGRPRGIHRSQLPRRADAERMKLPNLDFEELWEGVSGRCYEPGRPMPIYLRLTRRIFRRLLERAWRRM